MNVQVWHMVPDCKRLVSRSKFLAWRRNSVLLGQMFTSGLKHRADETMVKVSSMLWFALVSLDRQRTVKNHCSITLQLNFSELSDPVEIHLWAASMNSPSLAEWVWRAIRGAVQELKQWSETRYKSCKAQGGGLRIEVIILCRFKHYQWPLSHCYIVFTFIDHSHFGGHAQCMLSDKRWI